MRYDRNNPWTLGSCPWCFARVGEVCTSAPATSAPATYDQAKSQTAVVRRYYAGHKVRHQAWSHKGHGNQLRLQVKIGSWPQAPTSRRLLPNPGFISKEEALRYEMKFIGGYEYRTKFEWTGV